MKPNYIILGTSEDQEPLIIRAKEMGYTTHVFGIRLENVRNRVGDYYHEVNILDYDALWREASKLNPCGVATCASELAMHSVNFLLRKLNIPCNTLECETIATDKYKMRKVMKEAGIPSPQFELISKNYNIDSFVDFRYPLIAKPVDESSSRGVVKISSPEELEQGIQYAMSWSKIDEVIVEEFIEGPEYSGESIAYQGQYKLLAITEKTTTGAPHFIERKHHQPANISDQMFSKVEKILYKAFKAMGIEYGAIHPEFKICADGEIRFMEIAARMGGDFIGSELVRLSSGYDYLGMMINIGAGKTPDFSKLSVPQDATIQFIVEQSDLDDLKFVKENEPESLIKYSKWRDLSDKPIRQNPDRAGYFIVTRNL